jgi:hypothetical protein
MHIPKTKPVRAPKSKSPHNRPSASDLFLAAKATAHNVMSIASPMVYPNHVSEAVGAAEPTEGPNMGTCINMIHPQMISTRMLAKQPSENDPVRFCRLDGPA